jgi:hypothetical protein
MAANSRFGSGGGGNWQVAHDGDLLVACSVVDGNLGTQANVDSSFTEGLKSAGITVGSRSRLVAGTFCMRLTCSSTRMRLVPDPTAQHWPRGRLHWRGKKGAGKVGWDC